MARRSTSPRAHDRRPTRRPLPFRPVLQALEDRTTPTDVGWAILADPEGDVFHDVNGNGTFDAGESTVGAGWTVYADANENGVFDAGEVSVLTDAAGHYNLLLPDGTYSIRVVPQSPFQDDRRPLGTLVRDYASIESGNGNNFSGLAWADGSLYATFTRLDGVSDNVMYQVDPETGAAVGPAVSIPGEVGDITFDGTDFWGADFANAQLVRFNFAGEELARLSFAFTSVFNVEWDGATLRVLDGAANRIYQIDPSGAGTVLGYLNAPSGCNGLSFDGSHLWVSNTVSDVVHALDPATGTVQQSFTHYGNFGYGMAIRGTNLWLSDHESSRVFLYDLGYGNGRIVTVAGAPVSGVDLGVFQPSSISGRVFNDNNQNGVQDANDGGVAGWGVYLDSDANGQYDPWETAVVTDVLGNYTLSGLRPGPYTVGLDFAGQRQPRWSQVVPTSGTHSGTLASGDAVSGKNFANFLDRTTPISANEWGTFQGGEMSLYTGLAWYYYGGSEVVEPTFDAATALVANSTHGGYTDWRLPTKIEAQTAAGGGVGARLNLPVASFGEYSYWTSTPAVRQKVWVVGLYNGSTGEVNKTSHVGLTEVRDTGLVIDDGSAGYSATGFSSKSTNGAYQGDQSTATAGNGTKTATWTFTGLEAGATYKVDVTWKVVNGAASNAPFTIINGTTTTSKSINQSVAPNDFTIGETTAWEGLGTYTLSGSTLTVQLNKAASGTVVADAVRIFKVLPSYAPAAPLRAASVAPLSHYPGLALTTASVQPLLAEAVRRWAAAGVDVSALANLDIRVTDLGGATLGLASGHTVWLDDDAAGWGWFLDPTPESDSEFRTPRDQGEQGRIDLLSALMHELGHVLGRDHDEGGVMGEPLSAGERTAGGSGPADTSRAGGAWYLAPVWVEDDAPWTASSRKKVR